MGLAVAFDGSLVRPCSKTRTGRVRTETAAAAAVFIRIIILSLSLSVLRIVQLPTLRRLQALHHLPQLKRIRKTADILGAVRKTQAL
jgi:hypothetical protein